MMMYKFKLNFYRVTLMFIILVSECLKIVNYITQCSEKLNKLYDSILSLYIIVYWVMASNIMNNSLI